MDLILIRRWFSDKSTVGNLYWGTIPECYCLEDVDRYLEEGGVKIPGETAIPLGRYRVQIDWSNRFQCFMPHVLDVPQFTGIRIHDGGLIGEPVDTSGCIITGKERGKEDQVLASRLAYKEFFAKLEHTLIIEPVWLEVKRHMA